MAGIITFILLKRKKPSEGKDSLLGVTVMLLIFGIVGILFSLIFSYLYNILKFSEVTPYAFTKLSSMASNK